MIIQAQAPNRVLDFGGWTDTWFARNGAVLNVAVSLFARVTVTTVDRPGVELRLHDFGQTITIEDVQAAEYTTRHKLIVAALKMLGIEGGITVDISADVPPGCGTGSSAAITVALIEALSRLRGKHLVPHEVARLAHEVETVELGMECGIQDQIASAYGGICFIEMFEYPRAFVSPLPADDRLRSQLESQLVFAYEGKGHLSSDMHQKVIESIRDKGSPTARVLEKLKRTADAAKDAMLAADMPALGDVMNCNNSLQKQLHPEITTENIERIERIGRDHGSIGAMINGAGGGGSLMLLAEPGRKAVIEQALRKAGFLTLPFVIASAPVRAVVSEE
jgi:D-glycero-alpha-D-manno-heptose-7-phosphate kinase